MTDLKVEWGHYIFTPGHDAFVLEMLVPAPEKPYLLPESTGYLFFHINI